jgi:transposase-like protein
LINIKNIHIAINCPKCNYSTDVKLIDIKLQSIIICHNCKKNIQLIDDNVSTHNSLKNIEKEFKILKKTITNSI